MSDQQCCKCGREDLTGVAVRHIGGGGWHTKESCELPTPPVPSEDAREPLKRLARLTLDILETDTTEELKLETLALAFERSAAHVASRAAQEIDFDSLPDNMRSNQLQADGSYALPPRAAQPDRRKLAEKIVDALDEYDTQDSWRTAAEWKENVRVIVERILLDGGKQ